MQTRAGRGPIFEDGPGFETSFRLFHGKDGVVPLARATETQSSLPAKETSEAPNLSFHPLSASAAAISLSPFGPAGPFGFDGFMAKHNSKKPGKQQPKKEPQHEEKSKPEVNTNVSLIFFANHLVDMHDVLDRMSGNLLFFEHRIPLVTLFKCVSYIFVDLCHLFFGGLGRNKSMYIWLANMECILDVFVGTA
jgi:hypothetical protein